MKLFVYNKNADLHCISAKEAIISKLKCDWVTHLQRYQMWDLKFADEANSQTNIETIIDKSYLLSNPNKHFHNIATPPNADKNNFWFVKIWAKDQREKSDIKDSLNRSFNMDIQSLHQYILWEIGVDAAHANSLTLENDLITKIIRTSNQENGLLVNPLYEEFSLVQAHAI